MKIKAIKIVCFVFIFCVLLYSVSRVLRFKYQVGTYNFDIFYELENNSIDVLLLGNSHSRVSINPAILFNENGIVSYNLNCSAQSIWNTYYYLKEALKTQKPNLIVLEAYSVIISPSSYAQQNVIVNNTLGLKWSINRINNIKVSSPKKDHLKYINPLYQYHNRYSKLNFEDFLPYKGNINNKYFKGYYPYLSIYKLEDFDSERAKKINEISVLNSKSKEYLKKIIELALEHDVDILVMLAPYPMSDLNIKFSNHIKNIANEYYIPFVNFSLNYNEYDLSFQTDFGDITHLNYKGAEKFTRYLGKYLKENYDLPDRRGDPKYYSWEMNAKYEYKDIYNIELKQSKNFNEYVEKVKNADDYVIGITMLGSYKKDDAIIKNIATNFNINDIYLKNASYVVDNNKLIYSSSGSNQYLFYGEIGSYTDLVVQNGQKLSINRRNYIKTKNGINMVVYDKFTEAIVDNIYLEYKSNSINATIKR